MSDPVIEADADGVRETTGPAPVGRERAWMSLLARIFRTGPRFKAPQFVGLVERAQITEVLSQRGNTRFVVEAGSALVDLMAEARANLEPRPGDRELRDLLFYLTGEQKARPGRSWRLIRGAPEIWLINKFNLTRAMVPDLVVHVTLPPDRVMRRLRSEGGELLPYQTESGLERLQDAYREIATLIRRWRRIAVLEIDASEPGESAAQEVERICSELADERDKAEKATPTA